MGMRGHGGQPHPLQSPEIALVGFERLGGLYPRRARKLFHAKVRAPTGHSRTRLDSLAAAPFNHVASSLRYAETSPC